MQRTTTTTPKRITRRTTSANGKNGASLAPSDRYFDRELSWLEFNSRVLAEALNTAHPLLERLKFLAIFSNNLDEFFMIYVPGMRSRADESGRPLSDAA